MSVDLIHKQGRPSSLLACSVLVLQNYSPRLSFAALAPGETNGKQNGKSVPNGIRVCYIVSQLNINNDILMLSGVLYLYERPTCHGHFMTISDVLK